MTAPPGDVGTHVGEVVLLVVAVVLIVSGFCAEWVRVNIRRRRLLRKVDREWGCRERSWWR